MRRVSILLTAASVFALMSGIIQATPALAASIKISSDPFTNSTDSWQAVPGEPDPSSPAAEPGVYDVKSGYDGTAIDGTKYADW